MRYDKHEITATGIISVRMVKDDGTYHRYCLKPGDDLTDQPAEVVEAAEAAWTDEVIEAHQAQREAADPPPTDEELAERVRLRRLAAYRNEVDPLTLEAIRLRHAGQEAAAAELLDEAATKVSDIKRRIPKP